jgi:hypothetical protein
MPRGGPSASPLAASNKKPHAPKAAVRHMRMAAEGQGGVPMAAKKVEHGAWSAQRPKTHYRTTIFPFM